MSDTLARIVERASTDAAFRAGLERDPAKALAEYGLTKEAWQALVRSEGPSLGPLGVDARISKFGSAQTPSISEQDAAIDWLNQWWH
jgi:hypothetical protein